jgi:hypothetical protein
MYFWNIESLKSDIRNNNLTEKDRFKYAFVYIVINAITIELMFYSGYETSNILDTVNSILTVMFVFIGTIFAFRANGGSSGTDFLGRYFSIGFVITIRFSVLLIPLMATLMGYYFYAYDAEKEIISQPIDMIPLIIWSIALYWRFYKHISDVKNS